VLWLRAIDGSKSAISLKREPVDPKFQVEGVATDFSSVLSQCTRLTEGQTDRILIARPRLRSMQRGKMWQLRCVATWGRPTSRHLLLALITRPILTYPFLTYNVLLADTLCYVADRLTLKMLAIASSRFTPTSVLEKGTAYRKRKLDQNRPITWTRCEIGCKVVLITKRK